MKTTDSFDTKVNWQIGQKRSDFRTLQFSASRSSPIRRRSARSAVRSRGARPATASPASASTPPTAPASTTRGRWSNTLVMEARGGMNYFHNEALSGGAGLKHGKRRRHPRREHRRVDQRHDLDRHRQQHEQPAGRLLPRACRGIARSGRCSSRRSFTKLMGNHTIKFGEDFRHTRDFLLQTQDNGGPRGQFQFRATQTSIPSNAAATAGFANALRVVPARRAVARAARPQGDRPRRALLGVLHLRPGQMGGHEEAHASTSGLRHEYYTPFIGLVDQGGLSNYDPATNTLQVAGYGDVSKSVGVKKLLEELRPARGRLVPPRATRPSCVPGTASARCPSRTTAYVYNYPGEAEQRVQPAEQIRARRAR